MKNYYSILEIEKNADETLIKSRYRKLAAIYHPDIDPNNQSKFLDINEAYKTLMNPALRDIYDKELREYEDLKKTNPGNKITPYKSRLRDGGNVNIDIDFNIDIKALKSGKAVESETVKSIEKTVNIERYIKCPACEGEGKVKGSIAVTCSACHGTGAVKNRQNNINEACSNCGGYGDAGVFGGKNGNLNVAVKIDEDLLSKNNNAGKSFLNKFLFFKK